MALNAYLTQTAQLLQNPAAPSTLYSTSLLTNFVNYARLQIAGESESVLFTGTLAASANASPASYGFSSIAGLPSGVAGTFKINQVSYQIGTGNGFVRPRGFAWFNQYYLMDPNPQAGPPHTWAQYGQGETGSIYVNALDAAYTLNVYCVGVPIALASDSDPEAIPYPWTDCIQFFAAFWAYMSAQRQQDADQMYSRYQLFLKRARSMSTPSVNSNLYPQQTDATLGNKLGIAGRGAGGGQQ